MSQHFSVEDPSAATQHPSPDYLFPSVKFALLCAVGTAILEFVDLPPSLSHPPSPLSVPSLLSRLFFFLPLFLSASCRRWQSAMRALAARLVTDAAAVRQRGEKGTGVKMERGQKREGEKEQERERLREKDSEKEKKKKGWQK